MMKALMSMRFPLESNLMTTIRLAAGGISSLAGLNLDASEDFKVCVTESLLLLMHAGFRNACAEFSEEDGVHAVITGENRSGAVSNGTEDEIGVALLNALAENVAMEQAEGAPVKIAFRFER